MKMRLRKKIMLIKEDLEMCMKNQSSTGLDISTLFQNIPLASEKTNVSVNEISSVPVESSTNEKVDTSSEPAKPSEAKSMTKEELIHGTAEDGEPTW